MKIGVFVYNFPHYKSQQGLLNLIVNDFRPQIVFAQSYKKLTFYRSKIRTVPSYDYINNPADVARKFNINVIMDDHNSEAVQDVTRRLNLDLGVILGTRILKKSTIDCFNIGVLNMHPGIIPINRGRDNLKWAILDNIKQGVTSHLIDDWIDMGAIIDIRTIKVCSDDSLVDVGIKLLDREQGMMISALRSLKRGERPKLVREDGKYNLAVPAEKEATLLTRFEYYKRYYNSMKGI